MWKQGDTINVQGAIKIILVSGCIAIARPVTIICNVEEFKPEYRLKKFKFTSKDFPDNLSHKDCLIPKDVYCGYWSWEDQGYVTFKLTDLLLNHCTLYASLKYVEQKIPGYITPEISKFWCSEEMFYLNQNFFTFVGITRTLIQQQHDCYRKPLKL